MADELANRAAFRWQADFARANDAPIVARLCDALGAGLDRSSLLGRTVLDWPGDPIHDALSLRVTGALHALARAGRAPALAPLYAGAALPPDAVWAALSGTIAAHDAEIASWLAGPPQTNEAQRSAVLMAGLLVLADRYRDKPFELLEIGSSAGLNLLIDRYAFDLGGVRVGPAGATLRMVPEWRGPPPPDRQIEIAGVRGVDIAPLDLGDEAQAARLIAYVWPDQIDRLERIAAAIALARTHPPRLEQGDAADWIEARLAEPQAEGTIRVLMHSIVWQYLPPPTQARIEAAMAAAGTRATAERPLGWIAYEGERALSRHGLDVRSWPGFAAPRRLAGAHPHGAWIASEAQSG